MRGDAQQHTIRRRPPETIRPSTQSPEAAADESDRKKMWIAYVAPGVVSSGPTVIEHREFLQQVIDSERWDYVIEVEVSKVVKNARGY